MIIYLQSPLLNASQIVAWQNTSSEVPPSVGLVNWGTSDTTKLVPSISYNLVNNYITFDYGTHADHSIPSTYVELLMTFTIGFDVYKVFYQLTNRAMNIKVVLGQFPVHFGR